MLNKTGWLEMYCDQCGSEIYDGELYCSNCGAPAPLYSVSSTNNQSTNQQSGYSQPLVEKPPYKGLANASFYVGLAALIMCWVPILDMCLAIVAAVLSIIALTKVRKTKIRWMPITALIYVGISLIISICTIF